MKEYTLTRCLQATYNALPTHDGDTLYYCKDTGNCYLGSTCLFEKDAFKAVSLNGKIVTFTTHGENGTAGTKTLDLSAFFEANDVVFEDNAIMIKKDGSHGTPTSVVKEIVSASPTADGTWDKKGSMTVKRLQGSGCVVWNSLVRNGDFSAWTSGRFLPNSWSNGQYINSTYFNVGRIDGTHGVRLECKANRSGNSYMYCSGHFDTGHTYLFSGWVRNTKTVYIGDIANNNQRYAVNANTTGRRILGAKKITEGGTRLAIQFAGGVVVGDYAEIDELTIIDLTLMFGEGNEPDANEFTSLFPYNFYSYSAPTLLGNKTNVLRSVGYNLFKDGVALLAGGSYKIEGSYTSLQVRTLRGTVATPSVDSEGNYTRSTPAYLIVSGWDETTCVHVVGNGSRTGHEDAWTDEITVSVATILCHAENSQESVTPFPYGLLSIGNVRDEIVTNDEGIAMTAYKRIGVRDHIAADDSDPSVVTDGTHTAYILAEEEIYYLDNPFKAVLKADGWGEEISVPATVSGTDNVIASMPCRIVADYKGEAITSIDIDGDERDIHDKRISEADIDRWNTPSAQPSSSTPQMDGSASSGTDEAYARGDHRHPSDTTKADDNAVVHKSGQEIITGTKHFQAETMFDDTVYFNDGTDHGDVAMYSSPVVEDGSVVERRLMLTDEDQGAVRFGGVSEPKENTDAANKQYVDSKVGAQADWEAVTGPSSILHKPSIKAGQGTESIVEGKLTGRGTVAHAYGKYSHAEGKNQAIGDYSHAEGYRDDYVGDITNLTFVESVILQSGGTLYRYTGNADNVEIGSAIFNGFPSSDGVLHGVIVSIESYDGDNGSFQVLIDTNIGGLDMAEGFIIDEGAIGNYSHVEGYADVSKASGASSHAEGWSYAIGDYSHAEGASSSYGSYSHAEGSATETNNYAEHAEGILNKSNPSMTDIERYEYNNSNTNIQKQDDNLHTIHSIGVGYYDETRHEFVRKNAQEVMRNGDMYIIGIGGYDGTNATSPNAKTLQEAIGRGIGTAPLINVSIALTQNDVTTIREWTYTSDGPSFVSAVVNFMRAGTFNNTNRVGVVLVYSTDGGTTWERLSEGFCSMASNYGTVSLNGIVPSGGTVNVKMEAYTPSTDVIVPSVTQFYNNFYMRGVTMSVIGFNSASTIQVT